MYMMRENIMVPVDVFEGARLSGYDNDIENTTRVPVGDDLSYNSWFPNVSNSLSLVRYVLETNHCKINRLQRVLV